MTGRTSPSASGGLSHRVRVALNEVPGLLALVLVVGLWVLAVEDLAFFDEAAYMARGRAGVDGGFTGGAVYSDMYWLLSRLVHDPVNLYFTGRVVTAALFVLGVWAALRLHAPARVAWAFAAVAVVLPVAHAWPGVANPAAAIVLVCAAAIFRWPGPATLGWTAGALWIAAGARPEYVYCAAIVTIWALTWAISRSVQAPRAGLLRAWVAVLSSLGILAVLVRLHGTPFDGSRTWMAFGQHYGIRTHLAGEDNWFQWEQVIDRDFPGAESITGALTAAPGLFGRHALLNVVETPRMLLDFLLPDLPLQHPARLLATVMLVALAVAVAYAVLARPRQTARRTRALGTRTRLGQHAAPLCFLAIVLLFSLAPIAAIYPREHYLLVLAGFAFLVGGILVAKLSTPPSRLWTVVAPQTALFALFTGLTLMAITVRVSDPPILAQTVRALDSTGQSRTLLAVPSELAAFTPLLVPTTIDPLTGETFTAFLDRGRIDAVLVTDRLRVGGWSGLPGFEESLREPASVGFRALIPGSLLYVR